MLLTNRGLLQSKAIAIDNDLRGTLRNFGLKVGMVGTVKFDACKELVENLPDLAIPIDRFMFPAGASRAVGHPHRPLLAIVRDDEVCRRMMTIPGVVPVVAPTFRATLDVPARFRKTKRRGGISIASTKYHPVRSIEAAGYLASEMS